MILYTLYVGLEDHHGKYYTVPEVVAICQRHLTGFGIQLQHGFYAGKEEQNLKIEYIGPEDDAESDLVALLALDLADTLHQEEVLVTFSHCISLQVHGTLAHTTTKEV